MNENAAPPAPPSADMSVGTGGLEQSGLELNVFGWPWTGLVTLLTLLLVFVLAYQVARARNKFGIMPPVMDGPPEFLRVVRVHMNTVEHLVIFLPLLWITALAARDEIAAAIGIFWPISRILYAAGYYQDAKKRLPGFVLGVGSVLLLFIVAAVQIVRSLFIW